ncbi:MAG: hypothetical protein M1819_007237 [Sarea resinae]|nr:MAG: hypothetical protein M1819_007237 [Sarea resinae]
MGSTFVENYPAVLEDIWDLDAGFRWLNAGLPRWIPVGSRTRAHVARSRLNRALAAFHRAMDLVSEGGDPGAAWGDMGDVSELIAQRNRIWRGHGIVPERRSPEDLALLWGIVATVSQITPWILIRIISLPDILKEVRDEIRPYAQGVQPEQIFGIPEPPRLQILSEGISDSCPLLRACFLETLRMDAAPFSVGRVKKSFSMKEDPNISISPSKSYVLQTGSYVEVSHYLYQTDARPFPNPEKFDPQRTLESSGTQPGTWKFTSCQSFDRLLASGSDHSALSQGSFVETGCLLFVAAILSLWEFEAVDPLGWQIPDHRTAGIIFLPTRDVEARIKCRKLE